MNFINKEIERIDENLGKNENINVLYIKANKQNLAKVNISV